MKKLTYLITDKLVILAGFIGVVAASCTPAPVAAQEASAYSLVVHTASRHSNVQGGYTFNEVNLGLAIRTNLTSDLSLQGGVYRNSYYKTTVYAVGQYTPLRVGSLKLGGFAGLATGYDHVSQLNIGKLSVVGGLLATVDAGGGMNVSIRAVPKIQPKQAGVVTIEFGYRF
jgi:hypothetical protein